MRFWALTRREAVGVMRSLRYDLGRRDALSRQRTQVLYPQYDAYERPMRRGFAVTGVGLAVAGAAAGTYLAVAGGLFGVVSQHTPIEPVEAGPAPNQAAARPAGAVGGRHAVPDPPSLPVRPAVPEHTRVPLPPEPVRVEPSCICALPVPVPTPNAPSATPSTTEDSSPSPTPTDSPTPSVPSSSAG